jgi:predicted TIM-barrel fold metal-dependent hydrolase
MRVWEKAVELGIPVLAHGGPHQEEMYRHMPPNSLFEKEPAAPAEWFAVVREFPQLRLVLAHLAGAAWYHDDVVKLLREHPNVMLDNSLWYLGMNAEEFVSFIGEVGPDRIMFGSDYPGGNTLKDIERFWELSLDDEAKQMIAWRNATSFFNLPTPTLKEDV